MYQKTAAAAVADGLIPKRKRTETTDPRTKTPPKKDKIKHPTRMRNVGEQGAITALALGWPMKFLRLAH